MYDEVRTSTPTAAAKGLALFFSNESLLYATLYLNIYFISAAMRALSRCAGLRGRRERPEEGGRAGAGAAPCVRLTVENYNNNFLFW